MSKKNQQYTTEFKQGAVNMVLTEGMSRSEVGRRLGASEKNISRWVKEHQTNGLNERSNGNSVEALQKKIAILEKENRRLHQEREILKKAAAFFANESR